MIKVTKKNKKIKKNVIIVTKYVLNCLSNCKDVVFGNRDTVN